MVKQVNKAKQLALKCKQAGLTSVEYAVAGGLIVAVLVVAVLAFSNRLGIQFDNLI